LFCFHPCFLFLELHRRGREFSEKKRESCGIKKNNCNFAAIFIMNRLTVYTIKAMNRKDYEKPTTRIVVLDTHSHLLQLSNRYGYSAGGDGFLDPGIGVRSGYGSGGDGFLDTGIGGRSGYGNGGAGFGNTGIGGRSGYGDGGDGFY
jgi:hypothetical protein